ncbi:ABC transporter ATP-binding protein [Metamycoplasma phocicerebrale]|uniref:ABC transporter ATP-binding protein n=1 Tax=Metamycoplasma phocicerebrale TaxID=142649 RepID=A0A3T0TU13_9BACT|nr:ABC transporter ATP-binding protein [Metamycoplasma phocicerebrale]AZZ65456.1 ABC transporter ATP-binding protein [Metamycoplasma phocicerebrale]
MKEYAIEIKNLYKKYKNKEVLTNLSFNVEKGSLFSYLGLNGAGKSTTINILCQVLNRDSGEIKILNKNIDKNSLEIKKEIGIVFQGSCLDKDLSVLANLKTKAYIYGISKKEFKNKLDFLDSILDLKPILKSKYNRLSGGQKRRADVAHGLINNPKILFLDEPTTGLDPVNRQKVWEAIMYLIKEKNITIFLTTHYMEEAEASNKIIIIDKGKIKAEGTPLELKNKYSYNFLKIYCEKNEKTEAIIKKNFKEYEYNQDHYLIKIKDSKNVHKLYENKELKEIMKNIEIIKGNLQDVFLNVTGKRI